MRLRSQQQSSGKPSPGSAGLYLHGHGRLPRQPDHKQPPHPAESCPQGGGQRLGLHSHGQISETTASPCRHRVNKGCFTCNGIIFLPFRALCFGVNIGLWAVCFGTIHKSTVIDGDLCCYLRYLDCKYEARCMIIVSM